MDEDLEELADEARDKEVSKTLSDMAERYKSLYGSYPDECLTIAEIQEKIRIRSPRPFRLS